jgi:phage/plasmid-associated DNA primase
MSEKRNQSSQETTANQSAENALDALNTGLHTKRNAATSHRRQLEAAIEIKARKRRRNETPVSSGFKRG